MGGAGQPRSRTAGHWQNGLYHPFVPMSGSLCLHIQVFPPPKHLLCREFEVLPAQPAIQFVRVYKYPGEENGNRSTATEPSLRGKLGVWKWGWMLPFARGFRNRCNSEYWNLWKSSATQIRKKTPYILKLLFSCLRVTATILNSSCCARYMCLQEFKD